MTRKYYVGPSLLSDIRRTISRVDEIPVDTKVNEEPRHDVLSVSEPKAFRVGTATGAWSKGSTATVTWIPGGAITSTMVATNLFASIANTATYNCAVARAGYTWYLIAAECE